MLPFLNANDEEKNALNRWKWRMFVPLSRHYSQGPRLVEICIGHPGDAYHRSRVIVASRCVQITRANVENRLVRRRVTLRSQLRRKGNKDCDLRAIFSSVLGWWNVQCAHHHRSNANFVLSDFSKLFTVVARIWRFVIQMITRIIPGIFPSTHDEHPEASESVVNKFDD